MQYLQDKILLFNLVMWNLMIFFIHDFSMDENEVLSYLHTDIFMHYKKYILKTLDY